MKLTKQQVLRIPKLTPKKSVQDIADMFDVSWPCIWYWIGRLRESGHKVITRKVGKRNADSPKRGRMDLTI